MTEILVVNAGSSSLKCARLEPGSGRVLDSALAERLGTPAARLTLRLGADVERADLPGLEHGRALRRVLERVDTARVLAVGHP